MQLKTMSQQTQGKAQSHESRPGWKPWRKSLSSSKYSSRDRHGRYGSPVPDGSARHQAEVSCQLAGGRHSKHNFQKQELEGLVSYYSEVFSSGEHDNKPHFPQEWYWRCFTHAQAGSMQATDSPTVWSQAVVDGAAKGDQAITINLGITNCPCTEGWDSPDLRRLQGIKSSHQEGLIPTTSGKYTAGCLSWLTVVLNPESG